MPATVAAGAAWRLTLCVGAYVAVGMTDDGTRRDTAARWRTREPEEWLWSCPGPLIDYSRINPPLSPESAEMARDSSTTRHRRDREGHPQGCRRGAGSKETTSTRVRARFSTAAVQQPWAWVFAMRRERSYERTRRYSSYSRQCQCQSVLLL